MYCMHCGTELPDAASFCTNCGKQVERVRRDSTPPPSPPTSRAAVAGSPAVAVAEPVKSPSYRGPLIYGWLYVAAAVFLLVGLALTLVSADDMTAPPVLGTQPMGTVMALSQGVFFLATGLAILRRRLVAIKLVWWVTALAGLGVLMRGLIPIDIFAWVVALGLAKWFAGKKVMLA